LGRKKRYLRWGHRGRDIIYGISYSKFNRLKKKQLKIKKIVWK